MKYIKSLIFGVTLLAIFVSCKNSVEKKKFGIYYPDKTSGVFEGIIIENDTLLDGAFSTFDKYGKLKRTGYMVKGQFYGRYKEYYPNGKVESIRFKKNDKEIGEITWFRPDGSLDTYNFYDDLGSVNFVAKYDKTNKVIKGEGLILFEIYQHKLRKKVEQVTYKLGDPVRYQFMFPNIPNTTRKFEYELLDYDNSKIDRKETKIEPVTLDVIEKAAKKGENTIEARIRYEFNDKTHNVLADTIRFTYYVE